MNYLVSFRGGPIGGELRQIATSEPHIPVLRPSPPERPTPDSPSQFVRLDIHWYRRFCSIQSSDALVISLYEYVGVDRPASLR